jgi:hypothetical protein
MCTPGGSRTPNPQLRRLMLYPVELRVRQHTERNRDVVYRVELRMRLIIESAKKRRDSENCIYSHKTLVGNFRTTGAFFINTIFSLVSSPLR